MSAILSLVGRLGDDPEMKTASNGTEMCCFSICNNVKRGERETTNWFDCTAFGKGGEIIAKYAKKGRQMFVSGRLEMNEVTDDNGNSKAFLNLTVENFELPEKNVPSSPKAAPVADADIPF